MDLECYKLQVATTNIEQHKMEKENIASQDLGVRTHNLQDVGRRWLS